MKSPFSNWSLLNRLTLGVVLLSTLGFVASDIAAQSLLRNYLTHEVDNELLIIAGGSIPRLERAGIQSDDDTLSHAKVVMWNPVLYAIFLLQLQ